MSTRACKRSVETSNTRADVERRKIRAETVLRAVRGGLHGWYAAFDGDSAFDFDHSIVVYAIAYGTRRTSDRAYGVRDPSDRDGPACRRALVQGKCYRHVGQGTSVARKVARGANEGVIGMEYGDTVTIAILFPSIEHFELCRVPGNESSLSECD